ncbi:hypothetical protein DV515_00003954 [Chloebia gouldiae]|uniref:Uncharacterized protein n=1 Tax=Chloebia gouldiae TaxID=44316 RepID=A0A3L8SSM9_CHLGU|nr:hypothetical protein DV515_00003954 [Chloebia gouldiae]
MFMVLEKGSISGNVDHSCWEVDRIIFCVFLEVDYKIFKKKMGEFFPLGDANEEGPQLSEEREGQPSSPIKSKEEQPEDLQDDAEAHQADSLARGNGAISFQYMLKPPQNIGKSGNGTVDKENTDESKTESQEAGETKPAAVASLSSEDIELSENKDSLKDSKGTQKGDSVHPVVCEQDQAKGQQDVSSNEEIKTGADSQGSCMEIEDPPLNQDTTEVEIPLILGAEEKEEGKEEEGGVDTVQDSSDPHLVGVHRSSVINLSDLLILMFGKEKEKCTIGLFCRKAGKAVEPESCKWVFKALGYAEIWAVGKQEMGLAGGAQRDEEQKSPNIPHL